MSSGPGTGPTFEASKLRGFLIPCGLLLALLAIGTRSGAVVKMWHAIMGNRAPVVATAPVPATAPKAVLSKHQREWISQQDPQTQAETLMQSAIDHEDGSTQMIAVKLPGWRGRLSNTKNWNDLLMTALYSNDLRVRTAAIQIDLEVFGLTRNPATVDELMESAENDPKARPWAEWMLGMLANRGVETDKVVAQLEDWAHDPDEETRLWAIEGLANVGTDRTVDDFVSALKSDDSAKVRERAACGISKSGMLTRVQRMHAVPGLIDLADDSSLDDQTHNWVYQALREITGETLPNNSRTWRDWYLEHGQDVMKKFANSDANQVLGNS